MKEQTEIETRFQNNKIKEIKIKNKNVKIEIKLNDDEDTMKNIEEGLESFNYSVGMININNIDDVVDCINNLKNKKS